MFRLEASDGFAHMPVAVPVMRDVRPVHQLNRVGRVTFLGTELARRDYEHLQTGNVY
jgi:hypothetical protein